MSVVLIGRRLNSLLSVDTGYIIAERCLRHNTPPEWLLCRRSVCRGAIRLLITGRTATNCQRAANTSAHTASIRQEVVYSLLLFLFSVIFQTLCQLRCLSKRLLLKVIQNKDYFICWQNAAYSYMTHSTATVFRLHTHTQKFINQRVQLGIIF